MQLEKIEKDGRLKINWPAFISFFNATLQLHGSVIPELKYITKGKKAQVQRIVKELGTKQALIDTQGCILVGKALLPGHVYSSRSTLEALMQRLKERPEGDMIHLTVELKMKE